VGEGGDTDQKLSASTKMQYSVSGWSPLSTVVVTPAPTIVLE
jgi:hypothetical protein